MTITTLSDRRRCELALPARLLYRCFAVAVEHGGMDATTDDGQIIMWLGDAMLAPMDGHRDPAKLLKRMDRANRHAMAEYEKRPLMMAFLVVLYWVRDLTDAGVVTLVGGSPFDRAVSALIPRLEAEAGDVWDAMHRSATRGAGRLHRTLQTMGYFTDRPLAL